jgi:hypothetical protein
MPDLFRILVFGRPPSPVPVDIPPLFEVGVVPINILRLRVREA